MRKLLPLVLLLLLAPAAAATPGPTRTAAIFYYPWYSAPPRDLSYRHWSQAGHEPPNDIASNYYPSRGAYSSSNPDVLRAQMDEIAAAGVGEVVSSWWGIDSPENVRLWPVVRAAQAAGLRVAVHIEPYDDRSVDTIGTDIEYLHGFGIDDFYVYRAADEPAADWARLNASLSGVRVFAQTNQPGFAAAGRFAGLYTYDVLSYGGASFARLCDAAHRLKLLCAPSVGPGYLATAATGDPRIKPRLGGRTYDSMWRAALVAGADLVTITSYNEWGEGTQIEPAEDRSNYASYDGDYGLSGRAAERGYLDRTAYWTARLART